MMKLKEKKQSIAFAKAKEAMENLIKIDVALEESQSDSTTKFLKAVGKDYAKILDQQLSILEKLSN